MARKKSGNLKPFPLLGSENLIGTENPRVGSSSLPPGIPQSQAIYGFVSLQRFVKGFLFKVSFKPFNPAPSKRDLNPILIAIFGRSYCEQLTNDPSFEQRSQCLTFLLP